MRQGTRRRIRQHLEMLGIDGLVALIADQARNDPALFRRLEIQAAMRDGDDDTVRSRFARMLDAAADVEIGGYDDDDQAWVADLAAVRDSIEAVAAGGRYALVLELAAQAIERPEAVLEDVDSEGYGFDIVTRIAEIHVEAVHVCNPDPVMLARDLFRREMDSDYDFFTGSVKTYAEALGEAGLAEYRRLAEAALPGTDEVDARYGRRLWSIRDQLAERDGDVDARIALRVAKLSSSASYLVNGGNARDYARAAALIARMAGLRDAPAQAAAAHPRSRPSGAGCRTPRRGRDVP